MLNSGGVVARAAGVLSGLLLLIVSTGAVWAQVEPVPPGTEITIREKQPQGTPAVGARTAMNDAGEFVATWWEGTSGRYSTWFRRYAATGSPVELPMELPGNDTASQFSPDVAVNPGLSLTTSSGGRAAFVMVWTRPDSSNTFGIFARRFRIQDDGTAVSMEAAAMAVDVGLTLDGQALNGVGTQDAPQAAMDAAGNMLVTWRSSGAYAGDTGTAFARFYSASGDLWGPIRLLTRVGARSSEAPAVAAMPSAAPELQGGFVAAWHEVTYTELLNVRLFHADGTPKGASTNAGISGSFRGLSAGASGNGDSVVAAQSAGLNGSGIYVWTFTRDGTLKPRPDEGRPVNTIVSASVQYSSVGISAGGDFLVAFHALQDGAYRVFGQEYRSDGARVGGNFQINDSVIITNPYGTTVEMSLNPDIAVDPDDPGLQLVAAWNEGAQAFGGVRIAARRYRTVLPVDPAPPPAPPRIADRAPPRNRSRIASRSTRRQASTAWRASP